MHMVMLKEIKNLILNIIYISSKPVCLFLLNIREDIVNTINFNVDQRFWIRSLKYLFTEELKSNRFGRHTASNL